MPIEECFLKVKAYLRANDPLIQVPEIEEAILSAFASITPTDCYRWVKDCGNIHTDYTVYYNIHICVLNVVVPSRLLSSRMFFRA